MNTICRQPPFSLLLSSDSELDPEKTSQPIASPSQKTRVSKKDHKIGFRSGEAFGPQQMRVDKVSPSYKFNHLRIVRQLIMVMDFDSAALIQIKSPVND
jgi:hypothetical protein